VPIAKTGKYRRFTLFQAARFWQFAERRNIFSQNETFPATRSGNFTSEDAQQQFYSPRKTTKNKR
jgi:hypothetical protein